VVRMSQGLGWGMGGGVARALPCAYPLEEHHSTAEIEEPYNAREFLVILLPCPHQVIDAGPQRPREAFEIPCCQVIGLRLP